VVARSQIIDWRSWRAADHEEETLSPEEHTSADGAVQLMGRATFPEAYLLGVEVLDLFESGCPFWSNTEASGLSQRDR
jgi:hypothetical protein